ncbi:MAG: amidophosphoribosyltransferase [Deltaproteobacteria bacterium]|nr:amidophosphoribosyltransferase [Deltaproteobacteria bacterium]MBI2367866.1 amidophosphoribosyltransferase [Deltaproteobacteria bacterium]
MKRQHPDAAASTLPDKFREECAVMGVYGHPEAANMVYLGLYALQHRGQESSGIVSSDGKGLTSHRQMGLVADVFKEDVIKRLEGSSAIGHNRYSTTGQSHLKNAQPFVVEYSQGPIAISHNGNLVNGTLLREELERAGSIFQSTSDTEVIIHLIATSKESSLMGRIIEALARARGAYSLLFLTLDRMIAARDPMGFRPLVLGRFQSGPSAGACVVASETCALDLIEASYWRDVEPGEIVVIGPDGVESLKPFPPAPHAKCIFEYIYFARPDSNLFGHNVYQVRKALGRQLARENGVPADLVTPVPDSGVPAAIGYAEESGIPLDFGLIRNHYVGRTFIEPAQSIRHFGVKIKLNAQRAVLEGKRVVVVDDSIVRGTTSRKIIRMLRDAGAKEVHMRISSPPTIGPCYYGIDTPTRTELIAANSSVEEIRRFIEADSLAYLSRDGMYTYFDGKSQGFCDACFTANYPVHFDDEGHTKQLHLFDALQQR